MLPAGKTNVPSTADMFAERQELVSPGGARDRADG